jgi:hypothetical protein
MRIGPQCVIEHTEINLQINLMNGDALAWVDDIGYFGVFLVQSRNYLGCS